LNAAGIGRLPIRPQGADGTPLVRLFGQALSNIR
jgi:hypothetical protein